MPITSLDNFYPLSNYWTYEQVVSTVMDLTDTSDNEDIDLISFRVHLNMALSYLSKLLNMTEVPYYGCMATGQFEPFYYGEGNLHYISLSSYLISGNVKLSNQIDRIIRVAGYLPHPNSIDPAKNYWVGQCTRKELAQILDVSSLRNTQYRMSVLWTHFGENLIFSVGDEIDTIPKQNDVSISNTKTYIYDLKAGKLGVWFYRKPILDNLVGDHPDKQIEGGGNYREKIDLPDEYIDLLTKLTYQRVMMQLQKPVDPNIQADINSGITALNNAVTNWKQTEEAMQVSEKVGIRPNMPGGV